MSIRKERKAFESQDFIKRLLGYSKYDEDRNEYVYFRFEDYAIRYTCELNTAWKAWQASANREGYKLVPVDLIERCISHIGIASCHPANSLHDDQQMEVDIDALEKAMIGACDE